MHKFISGSFAASLASLALLTGCQSLPGEAYATPDEAAAATVAAVRSGDKAEVTRIMGPEAEDVFYTGDPVNDQRLFQKFVNDYEQKHQFVDGPDGSKILEVGQTDFPLAVPLVKTSKGWQWDLQAGKDEVVSRRVGKNELDAIQTCLAICDAEKDYWKMQPQGSAEFASKFISDPGTKNGLYWPSSDGGQASPLGELAAKASAEGYTRDKENPNPQPYHGYCYRILTGQGADAPGGAKSYLVNGKMTEGFAVVAWPFEYGNTGIMTFLVNQQGLVYQNDLGANTESLARGMKDYNPDLDWDLSGDGGVE